MTDTFRFSPGLDYTLASGSLGPDSVRCALDIRFLGHDEKGFG